MSLLQFKPAPMYILDEIDAALDLSHTQHIGQLFRNRFKGSQFIVVSLKEGLFTNANVLFKAKVGYLSSSSSYLRCFTNFSFSFSSPVHRWNIDRRGSFRYLSLSFLPLSLSVPSIPNLLPLFLSQTQRTATRSSNAFHQQRPAAAVSAKKGGKENTSIATIAAGDDDEEEDAGFSQDYSQFSDPGKGKKTPTAESRRPLVGR